MDIWTQEKRSLVMSKIKSKNTSPELTLRKALHKLGYRYRLHVKNLPGKPDLVFPKLKKVVFVHGCFWHLHKNCRDGTIPKTRHEYWKNKLERNVERDKKHIKQLDEMEWKSLVVWECEIEKQLDKTISRIRNFLNP